MTFIYTLLFLLNIIGVFAQIFYASVANSSDICSKILHPYHDHIYNDSALYFSQIGLDSNSPQLLWDGSQLRAVTYASGIGLIAELGDIHLEGLDPSVGTNRSLTYSSFILGKVNTTYVVVSNKPSTNSAYFVVRINSIQNKNANVSYGIFEYSVASRKTIARVYVGSEWTKLTKSASSSSCEFHNHKSVCVTKPPLPSIFNASMVDAGIICSKTLDQKNKFLWFSQISSECNAPQLWWDGTYLNSVSYTTGIGLIAELGDVPLEGMDSDVGTGYGLKYTSSSLGKANTSYVVVTNRPSTNSGYFVVRINSLIEGAADVSYGIFEHSVASRSSTARVYRGSLWTKLTKPKTPDACMWKNYSAICDE